jgi:hypothetical protein
VWDHDLSFGNGLDKPNKQNDIGGATTEPFAYVAENWMFSRNCGHGHGDTSTWFNHLWQDSGFLNTVAWRWKQMRTGALSNDAISDAIEYRRNLLKDAAARDKIAWTPKDATPGSGMYGQLIPPHCKASFNDPNHCFSPQGVMGIEFSKDFGDELDKLKQWIQARANWMDKAIPQPTGPAPATQAPTLAPSKKDKTPAPSNSSNPPPPGPAHPTTAPTEGAQSTVPLELLSKTKFDSSLFVKDLAAKTQEQAALYKVHSTNTKMNNSTAGYEFEVTLVITVQNTTIAVTAVHEIETLAKNKAELGNADFKFLGVAPPSPSTAPTEAPSNNAGSFAPSVIVLFTAVCAALHL